MLQKIVDIINNNWLIISILLIVLLMIYLYLKKNKYENFDMINIDSNLIDTIITTPNDFLSFMQKGNIPTEYNKYILLTTEIKGKTHYFAYRDNTCDYNIYLLDNINDTQNYNYKFIITKSDDNYKLYDTRLKGLYNNSGYLNYINSSCNPIISVLDMLTNFKFVNVEANKTLLFFPQEDKYLTYELNTTEETKTFIIPKFTNDKNNALPIKLNKLNPTIIKNSESKPN